MQPVFYGKTPQNNEYIFLWHCDGTNGQTAPFPTTVFNSAASVAGTASDMGASNTPTLSTTQKVFGATSLRCSRTPTERCAYNSVGQVTGSGNWTICLFAYFDAVTAGLAQVLWDGRPTSTNGVYQTISTNGSELRFTVSSLARITGTGAVTAAAWHYIAVCKSGSTTKAYCGPIAGNTTVPQVGSNYTDTNNYLQGDTSVGGGAFTGTFLAGYIDEPMVCGRALYTGSVAPIPNAPWQYP